MSFLDPYERNRRLSLLAWLRVLFWALVAGLAALTWWWIAG